MTRSPGLAIPAKTRARALTAFFIALAIGTTIALWLKGSDFYLTHPWDRSAHPDFDALRSSGSWGHGIGIAGTALILLNLTFMARRRLRSMRRFGALRLWMNMHVVTGLLGPLIVVFHTAFEPRTAVATIALASLGVLVLTGVLGRFIYAMIPHTVAGAEMGRQELELRLVEARNELASVAPPDDPLWQTIERLSQAPLLVPRSSIGCLFLLPYSVMSNSWLRLRLTFIGRSRNDANWSGVHHSVTDVVLIRRRLQTLALYRKLLAWWRGLHRFSALVMLITMTIHVVVLLYMGYGPGGGT